MKRRASAPAGAAPGPATALVRPEIRALGAYHAHDAAGLVKLDAMENPHPLPAGLARSLGVELGRVAINRYPDPEARALKARLAEAMSVPAGTSLVLGNGSDELIQTVALALAGPGATLLTPEPGFSMYRQIALTVGMRYVGVDLREPDFALDVEATSAALARERPAVVFLAYPNNPTGNLFERGAVDAVIRAAPGVVVVDEAYAAFAGETFMASLPGRPNLMVMRTVSKLGLAGLRLGVLAVHPAWAAELEKVRLPYNINALTQRAAEVVLARPRVLAAQTRRIREARERLQAALAALPGVTVWPSRANFLLFRCPGAGAVFEGLRERGILVRRLDGSHPALSDCLRVTVGTAAENRLFLGALRATLAAARRASA